MRVLKRFIAAIFLLNVLIFPQNDAVILKARIDSILSDPFFQSTLAAVDVYDLTSHESLYAKNEKMLLNPASNMKILTTAAALMFLEPDYQFNTTIYYTGNILNKILYGDIYIAGGGDPLFNANDLDSLIKKIKETGLKEITGNIYADVSWKDSLFWGDGWMWNDNPSTDAPYLSALNIDQNSMEVFVSPSAVGKKARIYLKPETGYVDLVNNTVTEDTGLNKYEITRNWINQRNTIVVNGSVKNEPVIDSAGAWTGVNIFDPAMYFTTLFYEHLIKSGIKVDGIEQIKTTPDYAIHLADYNHSIDSVLVNVNKQSYNLGAEMILYALAEKYGGKPATAENGIMVIKNFIDLIGLNSDNYRFADGSGVSRYNLVSAELLLSVLKYLYENTPAFYTKLYNSLSIAGVDGTLKKRMMDTPAQNNVHAKTGTLSGVSTLCGYVTSKNYHELAFSILIQNYVGKSSFAKGFEDRICEVLADYK